MSSTIDNSFVNSLKWQEEKNLPEANNNQALTQEDFFSLLSQQLSMQDPFKPVDNDQMISQMSSFATVDGINTLNEEIQNMNTMMNSSQALEASSLVGQKVLIPSATGSSDGVNPMTGVISAPTGVDDMTIKVKDEAGQIVSTLKVPAGNGGNVDFSWDGTDGNGKTLPAGNYSFTAEALVDGKTESLPVFTYAHVSSVTLGGANFDTVLNLRGVGGVKLADVLAVAEG
ncbi:flagellar hook assembly protein FlgD [Ferrimonas aestuarii]|uniref:Basal-body rod modification protein FlgD n=1 Tax=Ferrimonas aestuarii TaxID=2569539 RepID=A0A4U1BS60_9GAMM|nr:flagellar hook assembly protein FlgD [Ferrimonas aestuarii]TKB58216.1 flagellar hook assembly protein FlgD [Ferrimonas aestuarii]